MPYAPALRGPTFRRLPRAFQRLLLPPPWVDWKLQIGSQLECRSEARLGPAFSEPRQARLRDTSAVREPRLHAAVFEGVAQGFGCPRMHTPHKMHARIECVNANNGTVARRALLVRDRSSWPIDRGPSRQRCRRNARQVSLITFGTSQQSWSRSAMLARLRCTRRTSPSLLAWTNHRCRAGCSTSSCQNSRRPRYCSLRRGLSFLRAPCYRAEILCPTPTFPSLLGSLGSSKGCFLG